MQGHTSSETDAPSRLDQAQPFTPPRASAIHRCGCGAAPASETRRCAGVSTGTLGGQRCRRQVVRSLAPSGLRQPVLAQTPQARCLSIPALCHTWATLSACRSLGQCWAKPCCGCPETRGVLGAAWQPASPLSHPQCGTPPSSRLHPPSDGQHCPSMLSPPSSNGRRRALTSPTRSAGSSLPRLHCTAAHRAQARVTQQLAQVGVHVADWNQVKRARNAPTTPRRIPKGQVSS